MLQLILLILALVLFAVSGILYLWGEERPGLAGALLAFGAVAFTAASLTSEV